MVGWQKLSSQIICDILDDGHTWDSALRHILEYVHGLWTSYFGCCLQILNLVMSSWVGVWVPSRNQTVSRTTLTLHQCLIWMIQKQRNSNQTLKALSTSALQRENPVKPNHTATQINPVTELESAKYIPLLTVTLMRHPIKRQSPNISHHFQQPRNRPQQPSSSSARCSFKDQAQTSSEVYSKFWSRNIKQASRLLVFAAGIL